MDLDSQMEALEVVVLWSLTGVGSLISVCLLLGVLSFLFFLVLNILTAIFAYSGTDLWQNVEAQFQSANQKGLLAVASLIAKFQTSEADMKEQLSHLKLEKAGGRNECFGTARGLPGRRDQNTSTGEWPGPASSNTVNN